MPNFSFRCFALLLIACLLGDVLPERPELVFLDGPFQRSIFQEEALASVDVFSARDQTVYVRAVRHRISIVVEEAYENAKKGTRITLVASVAALIGGYLYAWHGSLPVHLLSNVLFSFPVAGAMVVYGLSSHPSQHDSKGEFLLVTPDYADGSVEVSTERMEQVRQTLAELWPSLNAVWDSGRILEHLISILYANKNRFENSLRRFDQYLMTAGLRTAKERRTVMTSFFLVLGDRFLVNDLIALAGRQNSAEPVHPALQMLAPALQKFPGQIMRAIAMIASEHDLILSRFPKKAAHHKLPAKPGLSTSEEQTPSIAATVENAGKFPEDIEKISSRFSELSDYVRYDTSGLVLIPQTPQAILSRIYLDMRRLEARQKDFAEEKKATITRRISERLRAFSPPLTQEQLARRAKINVNTLSKVMTKKTMPSDRTLGKIAFALGEDSNFLKESYRESFHGRDPYEETEKLAAQGRQLFSRFLILALRSWNLELREMAQKAQIDPSYLTTVVNEYRRTQDGSVERFDVNSMKKVLAQTAIISANRKTHTVWVSVTECQAQRMVGDYLENLIAQVRGPIQDKEWSWNRFASAIQELYAGRRHDKTPGEDLVTLARICSTPIEDLVASYRTVMEQSESLQRDAMERRRRALQAFRQAVREGGPSTQDNPVTITKAAEAIGLTLEHLSRVYRDAGVVFPLYRLGHLSDFLAAHGMDPGIREAWGSDDIVEIRFGAPVIKRPTFLKRSEPTSGRDPVWGVDYLTGSAVEPQEDIHANLILLNVLFGEFNRHRPIQYLTSIRDVFVINEEQILNDAHLITLPQALRIRPLVMQPIFIRAFLSYLHGRGGTAAPNRLLSSLWAAAGTLKQEDRQMLADDLEALHSKYKKAIQWFLLHSFPKASHLILVREIAADVTTHQGLLETTTPSLWFMNSGAARGFQVKGKVLSIEVPLESIEAIDFEGDPAIFRERVALWISPGEYKTRDSKVIPPNYRGDLRSDVQNAFQELGKSIAEKRPANEIRLSLKILAEQLESAFALKSALDLIKAAVSFAGAGIVRAGGEAPFYESLQNLLKIVHRELKDSVSVDPRTPVDPRPRHAA